MKHEEKEEGEANEEGWVDGDMSLSVFIAPLHLVLAGLGVPLEGGFVVLQNLEVSLSEDGSLVDFLAVVVAVERHAEEDLLGGDRLKRAEVELVDVLLLGELVDASIARELPLKWSIRSHSGTKKRVGEMGREE